MIVKNHEVMIVNSNNTVLSWAVDRSWLFQEKLTDVYQEIFLMHSGAFEAKS